MNDINRTRLLWAGFMAILAAGVGFSVRAGILGQWSNDFGFTMTELGQITGQGLVGFGVVIILASLIADKIGYGVLMVTAFILHFLSAVLMYATPALFAWGGKDAAYWCLMSAMFIFAVGNGVTEAVVNPLVATLYPNNKTHYLNILHAGWPAGLAIGALASSFMVDWDVNWLIQMSLFLIPVVLYGVLLLGQKFPKSEVESAGVTIGEMVRSVAAPLFILLLIVHAMVGYVELGTDSWISRITGIIMANAAYGLRLFVYTSLLMFALRFVAGPIVHRISPFGLLFVSSVLGVCGLLLLGSADGVMMCVIAATIYAAGKTFLWPTMLAVTSERFPKGGAVAIGLVGGMGMLSAGLIGGPAIGYKQDHFASQELQEEAPDTYERYKAAEPNRFLFFPPINGLDGAKVGVLQDAEGPGTQLNKTGIQLEEQDLTDKNHEALAEWWEEAGAMAEVDQKPVTAAFLHGGRMALKLTAIVPAIMALIYLLLILHFKRKGGYKALTVEGTATHSH